MARVEHGEDGAEYLVVEFRPPPDRDLEAADSDYRRARDAAAGRQLEEAEPIFLNLGAEPGW